jgi:transcriptional regulator with XRE-family HTH domain
VANHRSVTDEPRYAAMASALAKRLRELREARGITQAAAARMTRIQRPNVARAEGGIHVPTLAVLAIFARAYEVRVSDITSAIDGMDPAPPRTLRRHCFDCGERLTSDECVRCAGSAVEEAAR